MPHDNRSGEASTRGAEQLQTRQQMTSPCTQGCSSWLCQRTTTPLLSGKLLVLGTCLLTLLYLYGYGSWSARAGQDVPWTVADVWLQGKGVTDTTDRRTSSNASSSGERTKFIPRNEKLLHNRVVQVQSRDFGPSVTDRASPDEITNVATVGNVPIRTEFGERKVWDERRTPTVDRSSAHVNTGKPGETQTTPADRRRTGPVSMATESEQPTGPNGDTESENSDSLGFDMTKELMRRNPGIFETIPRETLPNYKNPCWFEEVPETELDSNPYRNTHYSSSIRNRLNLLAMQFRDRLTDNGKAHLRLRCMPYFYIIGMPKCGTTDLYYRLIKHQDVVGGLAKEPHWWTRRRLGLAIHGGSPSPIRDYLDLFDEAAWTIRTSVRNRLFLARQQVVQHNVITGEGSASTMWDNRRWNQELWNTSNGEPPILVANLLRAVQPHARLILTLRNPAERLYSEYLYFTSGNKSVEDFHQRVIQAIDIFNNCLKNNSVRACTYCNLPAISKVRLQLGLYEVYLRDWFSIFPLDQILVLRLEDHSRDPRTSMTKIFKFLRLEAIKEDDADTDAIFGFTKRNSRKKNDLRLGPMLLKTRRLLNEFYGPHNRRLAALLDDERFLWLKDRST
ncbi:carbohydrate sulfotransferase 15-like isoform X1 [Branchiostoma lanceolatum]|uniref:carbohydrate sulfotransferase 15-like isoform X1 n=2 Tax=Branchiostoma lanceolatum TaxID=7740 RepID=UPI0034566F99